MWKPLAVALTATALLYPASSDAHDGGSLTHKAKYLRAAVVKQFGRRAPGRDIIRRGLRSGREPTKHQKARYVRQLRAILRPPPSVAVALVPPTRPPAGVPSTAGLPACADESSGNYSTGPDNTNPSGATGRWQEMPMHRAPGGLCYGLGLSPAGQDECAQRIYASQGAGAWTACG